MWRRGRVGRQLKAVAVIALIGTGGGGSTSASWKNEHRGMRGDASTPDRWLPCKDTDNGKPTPIALTGRYDAKTKTFVPKPAFGEVQGVFNAAFRECFQEDSDEEHPPGKKKTQYEDGDANDLSLRIRPASHTHQLKPNQVLQNNQGYIVADLNITSVDASATTKSPLTAAGVTVDHSALLWVGRDDQGIVYSAVLNLANFPAVSQVATDKDLSVILAGGWEEYNKDKSKNAFARFKAPTHPLRKGQVRSRNHEGSWVACDPGCCLATGFELATPW